MMDGEEGSTIGADVDMGGGGLPAQAAAAAVEDETNNNAAGSTSGDESMEEEEEEEDQDQDQDQQDEEEAATIGRRDQQQQQRLPPDMALTDMEREWAWRIKCYVEAPGSELEPLPDMRYAQLAIICREDLEDAIRRIEGLQQFRELYKVQDTVEEGIHIFREFVFRLQPGVLIHADICGETAVAEPIVAWNQGACLPARGMKSEENFRTFILLYYYLFQLHQSTLHCSRFGVSYLIEGKGMTWSNFNQEFEARLHDEMWAFYPVKVRQMRIYNTNSVVNMAWSLLKPILKQELRDALVLGCQIEWDDNPANPKLSLSDLFFLPDYETAMQNMLERAGRLLTQRYFNEQFFRL